MKTKHIIGIGLLLMAVLFTVAAQTNGVSITPTDQKIHDALEKYQAVKIFIMPITMVLIMGFRRVVKFVPDQIWPVLGPFVGVGIDYVAARFGFWTGSIEAGLAMGAAATWFNQLGKQTLELYKEGPSITPSGVSNLNSKPVI